MEFAKPKKMMQEFAEPLLVKILKHFSPDSFSASSKNDGVPTDFSSKILPDNYYSFNHRRVWAKLRRLHYFVPDCLQNYQKLLFDELTFYGIYDFTKYEQEKSDKEKAKECQEIYRGTYSPEVVSSSVVDTNKAIMNSISSKVTKANKDNFIENLKKNLDPTLLSYVKIV